ncbi:MAG: hypothetical protein D6706_16905, partial [Chloroflexi bacterium]
LFRQQPRTTLPNNFTPLTLSFGNEITIRGLHLETDTITPDQPLTLTLAWQAQADSAPFTLFVHLVDENGQLVAQQDLPVTVQGGSLQLTRFQLIARPGTMPGTLTVMTGAYRTRPILAANGEHRVPVATVRAQSATWLPATRHPVSRILVGKRPFTRLVGYDWDTTLPDQTRLYLHWQTPDGYVTQVMDNATPTPDLPPFLGPWGIARKNWRLIPPTTEHYVPLGEGIVWLGEMLTGKTAVSGTPLTLRQHFISNQPVTRDLVVSVRLIGLSPDGTQWEWWDLNDSVPAMGAIPTLKWIAGSRIQDPHQLTPAATARPGQTVSGIVRLYDAFTGQPLPILDERITAVSPGIPLGQTSIQNK